MKTIDLETCAPAIRDLVTLAEQGQALILTTNGKPRFLLEEINEGEDDFAKEVAALSHNEEFSNYLDQARARSQSESVRSLDEVRRNLVPDAAVTQNRPLVYGKYQEGPGSTEEDFLLAEWHPTEEELDGP